VKKLISFTLAVLLFEGILVPAQAAYTSLYVFGDALSTTTNNTSGLTQYYYGKRYSNGRVWVEVLAQRQGLPYNPNNNWSYFDCNSANLVANVNKFTAPADAATALFVIWVNNSDMFDEALNANVSLTEWTAAMNRCQTNYLKAITSLYAKGVRTVIAPNVVDISAVPYFNAYINAKFMRQRCIAFNTNFTATLNGITSATNKLGQLLYPGLKIYSPDFFALLDSALTNAPALGLKNAMLAGLSIDATDDPLLLDKSMTGPGATYVFWDDLDPTARLHAIMADITQQIVSPAQISQVTPLLTGVDQLDVASLPIGLNGVVEGITVTNTSPADWAPVQSFSSPGAAQSLFVVAPQFPSFPTNFGSGGGNIDPNSPATNTVTTATLQTSHSQFYRLRFPFAWNWP
jgi:phospholipase/lecithinase/hemolysin